MLTIQMLTNRTLLELGDNVNVIQSLKPSCIICNYLYEEIINTEMFGLK